MPRVRLLDKSVYELIAAGEVIERPSSVIKELVENSIDSKATAITVEIKQGGISYIRITDNGCAMTAEDVRTAFMRHATSKLSGKDDLNNILTLGFRGEALASVCAVARCEVITKPQGDEYGTHYIIEGSEEKVFERSGCPDGTTIIVRDIFYNVPARLKFLKKDRYEGSAVSSILGKIAVSHPEISFRFIKDNRQELFTPGDSRLYSAVYSVFGKEFAASMLPVNYRLGGTEISGYTVKPLWGRKNRSMQHFFLNGRYVKSLTCMGALEEAYRNCVMEGKFPACVLFLTVSPACVDVNVHPAKTEVRFSDDKAIYDALYFAVKNALLADSKPNKMELPQRQRTEADYRMPVFSAPEGTVQTEIADTSSSKGVSSVVPAETVLRDRSVEMSRIRAVKQGTAFENKSSGKEKKDIFYDGGDLEKAVAAAEASWKEKEKSFLSEVKREKTDISEHTEIGCGISSDPDSIDNLTTEPRRDFKYINESSFSEKKEERPAEEASPEKKKVFFRIIGEAFKNYIIAETEDGIIIADKHAAHERIRFERLREGKEHLTAQLLLSPVQVCLDYNEYDAVSANLATCSGLGFEIELLDAPKVLVKGIPTVLDKSDAEDIVTELARNFAVHRRDPLPELLDDMYHTIACHGAIRGGDVTSTEELKSLMEEIISDDRIRYCPHGRPVMFKLTKRELEKQFKRIV